MAFWKIDPAHSEVGFKVKHLVVSTNDASMSKDQENTVHNNTADRRFELMIEGKLSMIGYIMAEENTTIVFTHTEVPEQFEGQGIASRLAKAALEFAKSKGLAVIPLCPFVKSYIHRHPEYQPLVK